MSDFFSFRLPEDFVEKYKNQESPFGFKDAAENSLGEITFIRTTQPLELFQAETCWLT